MKRCTVVSDDGVLDAVVGFRGWLASAEAGRVTLTSCTVREHLWYPRTDVESACRCRQRRGSAWREGRGAPLVHTCGIYAWNYPVIPRPAAPVRVDLNVLASRVGAFEYYANLVMGEVLLWGRIHVHDRGYRAQFARIHALYVSPDMEPRLRRLVELASLQFDVPTLVVQRGQEEELAA